MEEVPTELELNINGFVPADETGMEYSEARQQLQKELQAFREKGVGNKTLLAQLDAINRIINADSQVTPATKEIQEAKAIADGMVKQSRKELQEIAEQIKEYDDFIRDVKKNQVQLISKSTTETTISAPLIKLNETTKTIIAQQESPTQSYLEVNK